MTLRSKERQQELFARISQGDEDALSSLFLDFYDPLLHYGCRITQRHELVEECIQELFIYLFEAGHRLGAVENVRAYLYLALRRRLLDKIQREPSYGLWERRPADRTDIQFSAADLLIKREEEQAMSENLLRALNRLSWRQREAVYLRYYNGLSTHEIAEIMGVAKQTVLNTLYQALQKLRSRSGLQRLGFVLAMLSRWSIHL